VKSWIAQIVVAAIRGAVEIIKLIIRQKRREDPPEKIGGDPGETTEPEKDCDVSNYAAQIKATLYEVAQEVGTNPDWLDRLIDFESGWDPQAYNPRSSAKGLLQFTDATARELGYESSEDLVTRSPDALSQLQGPVRRYLAKYAPLDTDQRLFMAVFYPLAMDWSLDREFPDNVQKANPGIVTVADYIRKVWRRPDPMNLFLMLAALLGAGAIVIFNTR